MADPWLALEVLRELDEVGARYFALTLLAPSSLHHLVCAVCMNVRIHDIPTLVLVSVCRCKRT